MIGKRRILESDEETDKQSLNDTKTDIELDEEKL